MKDFEIGHTCLRQKLAEITWKAFASLSRDRDKKENEMKKTNKNVDYKVFCVTRKCNNVERTCSAEINFVIN